MVLIVLSLALSGVHTYQRMYGCEWDDETGDSHGFDEYSYDGESFISLDLKEIRYTASVPQAQLTVMTWNNDKGQLDILKQYYRYDCVYWLKELRKDLHLQRKDLHHQRKDLHHQRKDLHSPIQETRPRPFEKVQVLSYKDKDSFQ
uniref:MHC class I-like antigen recognition-like domain-containing protein n=1 Tax=Cyprinus carpio TaxID=7962 RepID=A0A8C1L7J7_CYPCA